eukprot:10120340-Alexandrium_andersonii.AAC.1
MARQVSAGCPAFCVAIRRRHGPAGPMMASHRGGLSGGGPPPVGGRTRAGARRPPGGWTHSRRLPRRS